MKTVAIGAFEAKTKFAELLEKVSRGQEFVITKRGKAIARLVGNEHEILARQKPNAWELYKKIQNGSSKLTRHKLDDLVRESRRELLERTEKLLR